MASGDSQRDSLRSRTRMAPTERSALILDAATRLFRARGFDAVSIEDVAAEAGVTRGLVHHYFGSKRELYLAVVEAEVRLPDGLPIVPVGLDGELSDVLAVCVDGWLRLIESSGALWVSDAGPAGTSDVDAVLSGARDRLVERMVREVPFPADLDEDLLRSALRSFAAMARSAAGEWLVARSVSRAQTAAMLHAVLVALVQRAVPAMDAARGEGRARARR